MLPDDLSITARQVRAAQGGDQAALEELLARYLPRVRRIVAYRIGRTRRELADVDDIVQETLVRVVSEIDEFEPKSEGSFCNWLARCVESRIADQVRRGLAQRRGGGRVVRFADLSESYLTESILAGREATPSQNVREQESEELLEQALLKLGARYREVIGLRAFCRMSYREIAAELGLRSENTANVLFLRARDKLRRLLA